MKLKKENSSFKIVCVCVCEGVGGLRVGVHTHRFCKDQKRVSDTPGTGVPGNREHPVGAGN